MYYGIIGKAPKDSVVIENMDIQGFRTLHLRHLWKWGHISH